MIFANAFDRAKREFEKEIEKEAAKFIRDGVPPITAWGLAERAVMDRRSAAAAERAKREANGK